MNITHILTIALIGTAFALAGCTGTADESSGSASLYIKDQPADDFEEVHVIITEGRVHRAGDGNETADTDDESGDGEWITIFQNSTGLDIDLLAVQGSLAAFIGEANLTAGKFTQIRFTLDSAYGIDSAGARVEITVTNGQVFITKPFDIEAGMESRIVIDIDLDRSLIRQGGSAPIIDEPTYRLNPVIGSTSVEIVDDAESGEDVHEPGEAAEVA